MVVYDGTGVGNSGRLKLYHNGNEVTFDSFGGTIPATTGADANDMIIGRQTGQARDWLGYIDEMRVFNHS